MQTQGLTDEQHQQRRRGIGGSDIGALLGLDRYKTPMSVWLDKTGRAEEREESRFTRWGHRLEAVIADEYQERFGVGLMTSKTFASHKRPWQVGTPDRLVFTMNPGAGPEAGSVDWGLEIKARGLRQAWQWGPETDGEAGVPDSVAAQAHWYMSLTGLPRWDVAVLLDGNDFRAYQLAADADIEAAMLEVAERFWRDHVEKDRAPALDGGDAAWHYLRERFNHGARGVVDAPATADVLARTIEQAKADQEQAKEREQIARQQLADLAAGLGARGLRAADWSFSVAEQRGRVNYKTVAAVLAGRLGLPPAELAEIETNCRGKSFIAPRFTSKKTKGDE